jgi:hypothetical protein
MDAGEVGADPVLRQRVTRGTWPLPRKEASGESFGAWRTARRERTSSLRSSAQPASCRSSSPTLPRFPESVGEASSAERLRGFRLILDPLAEAPDVELPSEFGSVFYAVTEATLAHLSPG